MDEEIEPTCSNCKFYVPVALGQGQCKKVPPVPILFPATSLVPAALNSVYPPVPPTEHCYTHEPKAPLVQT